MNNMAKAPVKTQEKVEDKAVETAEEKKPEFSPEELLEVFDAIMFEGCYEEDVTIRGKLKVRFKSKSAKDVTDISRKLDSQTFNLVSTLQEQRAFLSLVHGMISYNNRDLSEIPLDKRAEFLEKLPSAVVATLSDSINKFDRKVDLACVEGEQNF